MEFKIILLGLGVFLLSLTGHIVLWRIYHPRRHALTLFCFFSIPAAIMIWVISFLYDGLTSEDILAITLMHVSVSCAYIQLYPASQAGSPSMKLLSIVQRSMPNGMTEDEIRSAFDPAHIFDARVDELLKAGLIKQKNGKVALTVRGRAFIIPFILYRRALGIPQGKG